jgi:acetyltransferase-like isoleucine patch superfamily enzyme
MLAAIAAASRRARFNLWVGVLRARLRRQGVRLSVQTAPGLRFQHLPHLELDPFGATPGGTLTLRFGRDVRLGRGLTLDVRTGGDNVLELGDRVVFQSWARVQLHGGSIRLDQDVHVRDLVQLKTKSAIDIGARTVLSRDVVIHATAGVTVGEDCGIGERTSLIDSDHTLDGRGGPYLEAPLRAEPIVLGRGVAIGANCVLLRGTRMGDGSALAAGAVVNGLEVEPGWLAGGLPARALRALGVESS